MSKWIDLRKSQAKSNTSKREERKAIENSCILFLKTGMKECMQLSAKTHSSSHKLVINLL